MITKLFNNWSPEMAWILGLIFSDGNISKSSGAVTISSIDVDLLVSVQRLTGARYAPKKRDSRSAYTLHIGGVNLAKVLEQFGLFPAKSLTMQFPEIPDHYLSHFVRGCWDGDGTVFTRYKTRSAQPGHGIHEYTRFEVTTMYVSGSPDFIETLENRIKATLDISSPIKTRISIANRNYYVISYYHRNSLILLPWMYADSTSETRLSRKYEKAKQFI